MWSESSRESGGALRRFGRIVGAAFVVPLLLGAAHTASVGVNQLAWIQVDGAGTKLVLGSIDNPGAAKPIAQRKCLGLSETGCMFGDPAISPDGERVAFSFTALDGNGSKQGYFDIYILELSSQRLMRVTSSNSDSRHPAYAPNGRWLAFDEDRAIHKVELCGTNWQASRRLVAGTHPTWSPEGDQIAYTNQGEIYWVDDLGIQGQRLTRSSDIDTDPVWMKPGVAGSDGPLIAFASQRSGRYGIYMMDARGGNESPLSDNSGNNRSPDWPANIPLFVVYETTVSGRPEIWYGNAQGAKKLADGMSPATGYADRGARVCP